MSQEAHTEQKRLHELSLHTPVPYGSPPTRDKANAELCEIDSLSPPCITSTELIEGYNNPSKANETITHTLNTSSFTNQTPLRRPLNEQRLQSRKHQ